VSDTIHVAIGESSVVSVARVAIAWIRDKLGVKEMALVRFINWQFVSDTILVAIGESTVVSDARTALAWITDKLGDKAKVR
jgi:hypothetical protein